MLQFLVVFYSQLVLKLCVINGYVVKRLRNCSESMSIEMVAEMMSTRYCEEIVIAGFGGQGVILAGKLLAQAAMEAGYEVTYMPSYGAEVRGGTAKCSVVMSNEEVACPLVKEMDTLIVMNNASLVKYGPYLREGGLLLLNSSLIKEDMGEMDKKDNVEVLKVPADEIALEAGSVRSANMVMLGAYLQKRSMMGKLAKFDLPELMPDAITDVLGDVLAMRHHKTIPVNTKAIRAGAEIVDSQY